MEARTNETAETMGATTAAQAAVIESACRWGTWRPNHKDEAIYADTLSAIRVLSDALFVADPDEDEHTHDATLHAARDLLRSVKQRIEERS